jgi:hypothetical protein
VKCVLAESSHVVVVFGGFRDASSSDGSGCLHRAACLVLGFEFTEIYTRPLFQRQFSLGDWGTG